MATATKEQPKKTATADPEQKPFMANKPTYLPAPIEEINASISAVWESNGTWKKLAQTVNDASIKERMLKLCNQQEMPLIWVDIIPTQQGLKLYINGEGAKFNREKYLSQNGRRMAERQVIVMPYDKVPGSDPARDKNQGRLYFEITTVVIDTVQRDKIVDAVAAGIIKATDLSEILKTLRIVNEYKTMSAFSNQSEKYDQNRQPDVILKKGVTQCHRRADLEISSQCVLPEDEEPIDAEFIVKGSETPQDKLKMASQAAAAAATMPATTLAPDKVTPVQEKPPEAPSPASGGPAPAGVAPQISAEETAQVNILMEEMKNIFLAAKVEKATMMKWLVEHGLPTRKSEMRVEPLKKAIEELKVQFSPKPAAAASTPTQEPQKEAAEAKNNLLKKIFANREASGFDSDDTLRAWVKKIWQKGLSEMTFPETQTVAERLALLINTLGNYQKWGCATIAELVNFQIDFGGKPVHEMSPEELADWAKQQDAAIS